MTGPFTNNLSDDDSAVHRIAQPALHELAVREPDVAGRLEPYDTAGKSKVMEGRRAAFVCAPDDLLGLARDKDRLAA